MTQPCGHPDSHVVGRTTRYCASCADVASTAARAERAYCRGLVREEIAFWSRRAVAEQSSGETVSAVIRSLERVLREMEEWPKAG